MPRGVYKRKGGKRRKYAPRSAKPRKTAQASADPRFLTFEGREVLFFMDRFYVEVTPTFGEQQTITGHVKLDPPTTGVSKRGPMHCSNCKEVGHKANTCPQLGKGVGTPEKPQECRICMSPDHKTKDCEDFAQEVIALRDDGLDSLRIIAKLGVTLEDLKKIH